VVVLDHRRGRGGSSFSGGRGGRKLHSFFRADDSSAPS
jgi:hypothetical protein